MHEEDDFSWLLKEGKKVNKYALRCFKKVKAEFIETFGIDKRYEKYLDKVYKLELLRIDMALTGDKSKKIFADILELELEDLLNTDEIKVHNHGIVHVEKYVGFKLNPRITSTYDFYGYVQELEKQVKHAKSNG
jgi:hypothetical protein